MAETPDPSTPGGGTPEADATRPPLHVLLLEQAARTSNESDLYREMPEAEFTVVSNRDGWRADREIVVPAFAPPLLGGYEAWTAVPAWFRGLNKLDAGPVDVVTSLETFSFSSMQADQLAKRLDIPHAVTVAETMADNPLYRVPPWALIHHRLKKRLDLFICLTSKARDHLIQLGVEPERCKVLHLGVDTREFHPAEQLQEKPVVLFVGMFRANRGADKGVLEVVEACKRLRYSDFPELELKLVGDGHLRPQLEAIAAEEPWLTVMRHIPRDQIPELMRQSRALALGSKRTFKWEEQFGFVLVEAMASGLPVVSTRSGAIPEVVPDWNPLVAEGSVEEMVDGLREVLGPAGEGLGKQNRQAAIDRYEVRQQGLRLRNMLAELCGIPTVDEAPPTRLHLATSEDQAADRQRDAG